MFKKYYIFLILGLIFWVCETETCRTVRAQGQEYLKGNEQAKNIAGKAQAGLPQIQLKAGSVELNVEVARTFQQKSKGLQFRYELADGQGMLFIYDRDQFLGFWMKDTYIPLSIAYLSADGEIVDIFDMQPLSEKTAPSSAPVRYALEVPQGWFERAGLTAGDRFEFPRGFAD